MPLRDGEIYRCPLPDCGCEVTVTKSAPTTCQGQQTPSCCCGHTMVKAD